MTLFGMLAAFVVAFGVAALATPMVSRLAFAIGAVDRPNDRKVSRRTDIPLLGGLAVALGTFVGLSTGMLAGPADEIFRGHLEAYLLGGCLMLALGVWDDRFSLSALPKLVVQIAAAGIAIGFGLQIDHLSDPIARSVWTLPPWLMWLVTTLWIVTVTNAINLIDGLDGLATGVGAIIALTLTVIAWQAGETVGMLVGLALAGGLLGFLPFNFSSARIFLGDTGALFIGYSLALLALESYQRITLITFIVPLLALAVPIIDTGLSVLRRVRRRTPIFSADRHHMHHRLLESEGSQRAAVLSIYFLTTCFCIIAVSFTRLEGYAALLFLGAVVLLTLRLLRNLGFFETGEESAQDSSSGSGEETR